jgi:DedD protein
MSSDSSQAADLELQFKKRARRRLVGAIALVLVMLVVLPMVLDDHEHGAPQQAVTISIPSQNAEFTTQAPLKAPEPAPVQAAPSTVVENPVNEAPVVDEPSKQEVKAINNSATSPVVKEASEKKPSEAKKPVDTKKSEEIKKAEQAKKTDDKKDKPAVESIDKTAIDKTVKAKPNTTDKVNTSSDKPTVEAKNTDAKVSEDSGKPYYLQIGVFSESVNVTQLQKKLSELKLKAYTEKISTDKGDKTRLRVGPFESKDQADHAAEKVKTIGLSGFVSNK